MQEHDLNRLIKRAQQKDKEAFGEIYTFFYKPIFRYLYFSVRNRELAQDLTQDTFFKAWKALLSGSTSNGSFKAYLYTIARNLVIDYYRKKKEVSLDAIGEYVEHLLVEDPQDLISQDEDKQMVSNALTKLEENERQFIVLRFFEDLRFSEMAKILGKGEGSVRVATHRVLKKLRIMLKEVYET